MNARIEAAATLPTRTGTYRIYAFSNDQDGAEHIAIVHGAVWGAAQVPVRIHSECLTGDAMGSLRCDCREQLETALQRIAGAPCGIVLYLRQEGRGIGLTNKIRAYQLQEEHGLDTVDANIALGFDDDERDYGIAVAMLKMLGVRSVELMTNNPDKIRQLDALGMPVAKRLPHATRPGVHNHGYLATKARKSGHLIDAALLGEKA